MLKIFLEEAEKHHKEPNIRQLYTKVNTIKEDYKKYEKFLKKGTWNTNYFPIKYHRKMENVF